MLRSVNRAQKLGACLSSINHARFMTATINCKHNSPLTRMEGLFPKKSAHVTLKERFRWNAEEHETSSQSTYDTLCMKVHGFDMVLVEKYARCVHRLLQQQKIQIKEMYALPLEHNTVKHSEGGYSADESAMKVAADLQRYTRVVQAGNMPSTAAPILIQMLVREIPPGVELSIEKYSEEEHLKRFKANKELEAAKDDLAKLWASR